MGELQASVAAITPRERAGLLRQTPAAIWLTGLSGAGKSTIARHLERQLHLAGRHTALIDGDEVRRGLSSDLGFTDADRAENIRRVAYAARLMMDAGLIVIVSMISPFRAERLMARDIIRRPFVEVHVDTPLAECERRDPKGLYAMAREGLLRNFTGVDSRYEQPLDPEVRVDTLRYEPARAAKVITATVYMRAALSQPRAEASASA
ncbi:MAG: adenylyl-sulfate kinase [Hyphomonadaceae bacterium]